MIALAAGFATAAEQVLAAPHPQTPHPSSCTPEPVGVGGQQVRGCLTAADQISDGTGVTVAGVDIRGAPGWIVLHPNDGGEPGPRLGVAPVRQGRSTQVIVPATRRLTTGDYWPMLHLDAGITGVYQFPAGPDVPVVDTQGMVMKRIHVTVRPPAATP